MRYLPPIIFSEYEKKIFDTSYYPTTPAETLKSRLTASWLLQSLNPDNVNQAKKFILKTSTNKQDDLSRLERLAAQVHSWDELQICSTQTKTDELFLEYKLFVTLKEHKQGFHFHARYQIVDKLCCFISQTNPLIRIVGDPILQQPGIHFPEHASLEQHNELTKQIEIAKSVLIQTGGAGIAANQCVAIQNPYLLTIVGVYHDILEHATKVAMRYPNTRFPQALVMVNPIITAVSDTTQTFNHGCLSIPCANRCTVISPTKISVTYQDPFNGMQVKKISLADVDAVVLWHELNHINHGKTYMDITFDSLATKDLIEFKNLMNSETERRHNQSFDQVPELAAPSFYHSVKVTDCGILQLDTKELTQVLPKMTDETLFGLMILANTYLEKKLAVNSRLELQAYKPLLFSGENTKHNSNQKKASALTL